MNFIKKQFLLFSLILTFMFSSQVYASENANYNLVALVFRIYQTTSIDVVSGEKVHDTIEKLTSKELSLIDFLCDSFDSADYLAKKTSNRQYILDLYQAVFNETPTSDQIVSFVEKMSNRSRESALKEILIGTKLYDLCVSYDIHMVKDMDHPLMQYAKEVLEELDWDLKAAFEWSHTDIYYDWPYSPGPNDSHLEFYGRFGFENGYGNCYVMSSVFCWLARMKGITIYTVEGYVPLAGGTLAEHGWCEAIIDDKIYVFDSSWSRHGNDGFMIQYKQKGTYVYTDYKRVY